MGAPGAQFCGSCGGNLAGAPPPPPPAQNNFQNMAFSAAGGSQEQTMTPLSPDAAFDAAMSQLTAASAQFTWQQRPTGIRFKYAKFSCCAGFKVKYEGALNITPYGPGQSQISLSLKAANGDMVMEWIMVAICLVLFIVMTAYTFQIFSIVLAGLLGVAWVFVVTSKLPKDTARQFLQKIGAGPAMAVLGPMPTHAAQPIPPAPPAPHPVPSPPPPAPPAPPPPEPSAPLRAPPPPAAGHDAAVAQLKALAGLREQNLITQEEFDAKKSEILTRMMQ